MLVCLPVWDWCAWGQAHIVYVASEPLHACNATAWETASLHCWSFVGFNVLIHYGRLHLLHVAEEDVRAGVRVLYTR